MGVMTKGVAKQSTMCMNPDYPEMVKVGYRHYIDQCRQNLDELEKGRNDHRKDEPEVHMAGHDNSHGSHRRLFPQVCGSGGKNGVRVQGCEAQETAADHGRKLPAGTGKPTGNIPAGIADGAHHPLRNNDRKQRLSSPHRQARPVPVSFLRKSHGRGTVQKDLSWICSTSSEIQVRGNVVSQKRRRSGGLSRLRSVHAYSAGRSQSLTEQTHVMN